MDIYVKAGQLVERLGTNDPFTIADLLGIEVTVMPLKSLKGLIVNTGNRKHIGINSQLAFYNQKFILAHEIGHHLLHPAEFNYFCIRDHTYFVNGKYEREADLFAFCLVNPGINRELFNQAKQLNRQGLVRFLFTI